MFPRIKKNRTDNFKDYPWLVYGGKDRFQPALTLKTAFKHWLWFCGVPDKLIF